MTALPNSQGPIIIGSQFASVMACKSHENIPLRKASKRAQLRMVFAPNFPNAVNVRLVSWRVQKRKIRMDVFGWRQPYRDHLPGRIPIQIRTELLKAHFVPR